MTQVLTKGLPESRSATVPKALYPKLKRGRRGRYGLTSKQVADNQRRRLQGAMIEAVSRRGYQMVTAREVCILAGVSEKAFYAQFEKKHDCYLATYDAIVHRAAEQVAAAYRSETDCESRLVSAFAAYAALVTEQPKAAGLALFSVLEAGPDALARMRTSRLTFERMVRSSFAAAPYAVALPTSLVTGIVCGIERITRQRLINGVGGLPGLADELVSWVLSYRCADSERLKESAAARHVSRSLTTRPPASAKSRDERIRIMRATAEVAAESGYAWLRPAAIAERADVPRETLDESFASVEDCFLGAIDLLTLEALMCAARGSQSPSDPLRGVCRGMSALMRHVATDPVLQRVAFVEVFALPDAVAHREDLLHKFNALLLKRLPAPLRPSELMVEASVGAIWGLVHHHVTCGSARDLPALADHASYLALAPAIGGKAAVDLILSCS